MAEESESSDTSPPVNPETQASAESAATPEGMPAAGTKDGEILQEILQCLEDIELEFDFKVLDVLEDERATPLQIEGLKEKLGPMVSTRLFSIANSVHYGKQRSGNITKFIEVVTRLGTDTTRTTAIFVALLSLANTEELRIIFARNFATSKLGEMFAIELDIKGANRSAITLGGLFVEMGKVIMLLYAEKSGIEYKEDFVDTYQAHIGAKVIEKFELPEYLIDIIDHPCITFEKKDRLALSAVVDMAHAVVNDSFARFGKLRVKSPMPDKEGLLYQSTVGSVLKEQFNIMGIGAYMEVLETEYTEQEQRFLEKASQDV